MSLAADCSRCVGLCCVAPAFAASTDFAFSKPAGVACRHLAPDASCTIHDRLIPSGFPGCVAYDCFGAGQRVVALFGGGPRSAPMLSAYETVRQLHELLWYVADALSRPPAAPVHAAIADARRAIEAAIAGGRRFSWPARCATWASWMKAWRCSSPSAPRAGTSWTTP